VFRRLTADLNRVRQYLKEMRVKYPRNNREWRSVTVRFSRKNWSKHLEDPGWYSTRLFQIKRVRGEWVARIVDTKGDGWMWARSEFTGVSWKDPVIVTDSRKPKPPKVWEVRPEDDPDWLEIV
jgi:hypothetical protein